MVVGSSRLLLLVVGSVTAAALLFQVAMMNMIMEAFMPVAEVPAEPVPEPPALATSEFIATLLDGATAVGGRAHVYEPQFKTTSSLPVVLMHGMGDAAGHTGMLRIRDVRTRMREMARCRCLSFTFFGISLARCTS